MYRIVRLLEKTGGIDCVEFGDGRARFRESVERNEHLVDVKAGEAIERKHVELEALKEKINRVIRLPNLNEKSHIHPNQTIYYFCYGNNKFSYCVL